MADIKLEDFGFSSCEPTGALAKKVYYAPLDYFDTIGTPKGLCGDSANAATTLEELVNISSMTFKEGKGFHEFTGITETGELTTTQIGEVKRRLFENTLSAQVQGSSPKLLGFCRWVKNRDLIVVVKEADSGQMRVIGSELMPAWVETQEHKIEAAPEGNNSLTITFKDKSKWPAAVYTGDIVLFPAIPPIGG